MVLPCASVSELRKLRQGVLLTRLQGSSRSGDGCLDSRDGFSDSRFTLVKGTLRAALCPCPFSRQKAHGMSIVLVYFPALTIFWPLLRVH